MNAAQMINQTSGRVEYYTPANIIEAARRTMGGIDLDPASSYRANLIVRATDYFTEQDDALGRVWRGRVWMNHPFGRQSNPAWIFNLVDHYRRGLVTQACCITFACTSEEWFGPLFDYPMCFLRPRTNYIGPDGKTVRGVTKGSVVTYLGPHYTDFMENFEPLGKVVFPASMWRQRALNHTCDLREAVEMAKAST